MTNHLRTHAHETALTLLECRGWYGATQWIKNAIACRNDPTGFWPMVWEELARIRKTEAAS